jgi:hypothetical protein
MRSLARLVLLAGAVALAIFFFRAGPRDLTLVYGIDGNGAGRLEVAIEKDGEVVRRAEFRLDGAGRTVSHRVRLTDGEYRVRALVVSGGPARTAERSIHVSEDGTIVIPLETASQAR